LGLDEIIDNIQYSKKASFMAKDNHPSTLSGIVLMVGNSVMAVVSGWLALNTDMKVLGAGALFNAFIAGALAVVLLKRAVETKLRTVNSNQQPATSTRGTTMSLYDGNADDPKASALRSAGWVERAATDPRNAYWGDPLRPEREFDLEDAIEIQHDRDTQFDKCAELLTEAAARIERIGKNTNDDALLMLAKIRAETYRDAALLLREHAARRRAL
jgi:hypothetical protein